MSLLLRRDVDSRMTNSARALIALALAGAGCAQTVNEPLSLACLRVEYNTDDNQYEIDGVRNGVRIGTNATITVVSTDPNSVSGTDLSDVILCTENNINACTRVRGERITSHNTPMSRTRDSLSFADHPVRLIPFHATPPVNAARVDGVVIQSYVAPRANSTERHDCPPLLIRFVDSGR